MSQKKNSALQLQDYLDSQPKLKDIAKGKTFTRKIMTYPGVTFDRPMGRSARIYTPSLKGALWGTGEQITLSMLKTDVFDRRYFRTKPVTVDEVMKGAFSPANKEYDDMPKVGLTRPKYGTLLETGGRIDKQAWE